MEFKKTKPLAQKTKLIWTSICAIILVGCVYCQIFVFPWGNHSLIATLALIAVISIIGLWTKTDGASKLQKFVNVLLYVGLMVGELFLTMYFRDSYIEYQVDKYGVITNGEVVEIFNKPSGRGRRKMATIAYTVNGWVTYNDVANGNNRMEKRDRVKIIYSSKDRNIFSITKIIKADIITATFIDTPPEYQGGMPALYTYLRNNVVYPQQAREQRITGKVFVSFVITQDGSVTDAKIEKGIGGGCDEAALHAVNNMPNWKPGVQNGKPVRVKYNIPISFSL